MDETGKFLKIKSIHPKLKQFEIAREWKKSSSKLQRFRRELNMIPPYRILPSSNNHTRKQKTSDHTDYFKMTSKYPNENAIKVKPKHSLRGGDRYDNPNDKEVFLLNKFFLPNKWLSLENL